jgi:hypothetical protein
MFWFSWYKMSGFRNIVQIISGTAMLNIAWGMVQGLFILKLLLLHALCQLAVNVNYFICDSDFWLQYLSPSHPPNIKKESTGDSLFNGLQNAFQDRVRWCPGNFLTTVNFHTHTAMQIYLQFHATSVRLLGKLSMNS